MTTRSPTPVTTHATTRNDDARRRRATTRDDSYGDLSLEYVSSRVFSIFFILFSVLVVGAAIGNVQSVQADIAAEKKQARSQNRPV